MEPTLIVFGIKALVRCCSVGQKALDQVARDQGAVFPELIKLDLTKKDVIFSIFIGEQFTRKVLVDNNLAPDLLERARNDDAAAIDTLFLLAAKLKAAENVDINGWVGDQSARAGVTLIKQWSQEKAPASPLARFMLSAADIALEYAAIHPKLLEGDESDKLLAAFAGNLSQFIDNNGDFGKQNGLLSRLSAGFLRAGLETISENPQWVSSEKHLQAFITSTTKPLLAATPDTLAENLNYQQMLDTLSGPVFKAALNTIAEHQTQFFGEDLVTGQALGALTQALLRSAAKGTFQQSLSKGGLLTVYQSALEVAIKQPQLFIKNDGSPKDNALEQLFVGVAETLRKHEGTFGKELATQLVSTVIATAADNLSGLAGDGEWSKTYVDMATTLLRGLDNAIKANQPLRQAFSAQQWQDLGRILLQNLAQTPSLVIGQKAQFEGVVTAVATAMANDKHLLLKGDNWVRIAEVAAQEAATNPGRLFKLNADNPKDMRVAQLISLLINTATDSLNAGTVLYGETLQKAIVIALQSSSGNVKGLAENLDKIEAMVRKLTSVVAENPEQLGSKEWLRTFENLLPLILQGNSVEPITLENILQRLKKER